LPPALYDRLGEADDQDPVGHIGESRPESAGRAPDRRLRKLARRHNVRVRKGRRDHLWYILDPRRNTLLSYHNGLTLAEAFAWFAARARG
jgi:hypothetical protein